MPGGLAFAFLGALACGKKPTTNDAPRDAAAPEAAAPVVATAPAAIALRAAASAQGRVWIVTDAHMLISLDPTLTNTRAEQVNRRFDALHVASDGALLALETANGETRLVDRFADGAWTTQSLQMSRANERVDALSDVNGRPFVANNAGVYALAPSGKTLHRSFVPVDFASGITAAATANEDIYVGVDDRSLGGIRRLRLDRDVPQPAIDEMREPVTSVTRDPKRPDCVYATIAITRPSESGRVVRICGTRVETVLRREPDAGTGEAMLAAAAFGDGEVVIGTRGVYVLGPDGEHDSALPTFAIHTGLRVGEVGGYRILPLQREHARQPYAVLP